MSMHQLLVRQAVSDYPSERGPGPGPVLPGPAHQKGARGPAQFCQDLFGLEQASKLSEFKSCVLNKYLPDLSGSLQTRRR